MKIIKNLLQSVPAFALLAVIGSKNIKPLNTAIGCHVFFCRVILHINI